MASYIVLNPPGATGKDEDALFVRDGFSWFGFLLPLIYLLWHRLWLMGFALLGAIIGLSWLALLTELPVLPLILTIMAGLYVGLEGGRMCAAQRLKEGWTETSVVVASRLANAEGLYFGTESTDMELDDQSIGRFSWDEAKKQPASRGAGPALGLIDPYGDR